MLPTTKQGRLVAIGVVAQVLLFVSFLGAANTEAGALIAVAVVAALACLVVATLVEGWLLTLLFAVPSLVFLVVFRGLLFALM